MFSQVTVAAVAAPLAVVSALFALVFLRYGTPRAARNGPNRYGQETVGISQMMCEGNVALVVGFLLFAMPRVTGGFDPPLFAAGLFPTSLPTTAPGCALCDEGPDPNILAVRWMQLTLIVALIWYTLSIAVLIIEMSAGRSRRQRRSASSE